MSLPGKPKLKISLIIPVFNEEQTINTLLDSICNQTLSPDEIIIVDAGSTDRTPNILDDEARNKKNLKVIKERRCFPGRARNIGVMHAKGDILVFSDAGFILDNNWMEYLYQDLLADKDLCFGNWQVHLFHNNGFYRSCRIIFSDSIVLRDGKEAREESVASMMMWRETWNRIVPFREDLRCGEDVIFIKSILDSNFKVGYSLRAVSYWLPPTNIKEIWSKQFSYSKWREVLELNRYEFLHNLILVITFIFFSGFVNFILAAMLVISYFLYLLVIKSLKSKIEIGTLGTVLWFLPIQLVVFLSSFIGGIHGKWLK